MSATELALDRVYHWEATVPDRIYLTQPMGGGLVRDDGMPRIRMPLGPSIEAPSWHEIVAATEPLAENVRREADEMATIVYTSGSTGVPKGVMLSFGAMAKAGAGVVRELGVREDERLLSYLTPTMKLKRAKIEDTYLPLAESWYETGAPVVWQE